MKKIILLVLFVFILFGGIGIYVYGLNSDNNEEKVVYHIDKQKLEETSKLVSKDIKLDAKLLEMKLNYIDLNEKGELAPKKAKPQPIIFNPENFITTESGSLSSAYNTGYHGTITIPDAGVYNATLYRSSDQTLIDNDIYATELLDWSGVLGVSGSAPVICGHNNIGVFGGFGNLSVGSQVYFDTSFGEFIYEVTGFAIGDVADGTIYFNGTDITAYGSSGNQLVLYTCYPLTAHPAVQRYLVFANLINGTPLS